MRPAACTTRSASKARSPFWVRARTRKPDAADEIRIETRKHALAPLQYRHPGARVCGDVREHRGDVPAAAQYNPVRQPIQFQELLICDEVFCAGECERYRPRSGRD